MSEEQKYVESLRKRADAARIREQADNVRIQVLRQENERLRKRLEKAEAVVMVAQVWYLARDTEKIYSEAYGRAVQELMDTLDAYNEWAAEETP